MVLGLFSRRMQRRDLNYFRFGPTFAKKVRVLSPFSPNALNFIRYLRLVRFFSFGAFLELASLDTVPVMT
jgi:hypothetical protein